MTNKYSNKLALFAGCAPGLEQLLETELKQRNMGNTNADAGGVSFTGTLETLVRANLQSRIADRILLRIGSFKTLHLSQLETLSAALPFERFIGKSVPVFVNAICKKSRIYHSGAAAQRIAKAISSRTNCSTPQCQIAPTGTQSRFVSIQVRILHDEVTISVDTSGELLHKRGYRTHTTDAPMRETVAAAALQFCEYTGEFPLVDPMCGSGTFPIEAAQLASRTAPGLQRHFAFEYWPSFSKDVLQSEQARAARFATSSDISILASDISQKAIDAATQNIENAHLGSDIHPQVKEFSKISLPGPPGIVIMNPPWGKRLNASKSDEPCSIEENRSTVSPGQNAVANKADLLALYQQIGQFKKHNPTWQLCLITASTKLAKSTGIRFKKISPPIPMGGVRIRFYLG